VESGADFVSDYKVLQQQVSVEKKKQRNREEEAEQTLAKKQNRFQLLLLGVKCSSSTVRGK
jgi:hypothetical protein